MVVDTRQHKEIVPLSPGWADRASADKTSADKTSADKTSADKTGADGTGWWARFRRRWPRLRVSRLTLRILGVNVLALLILVAGLMYQDVYRRNLIEAQVDSLTTKGGIFAGALGEGAVRGAVAGAPWLEPDAVRALVRRLVQPTRTRARVFVAAGDLIADSRKLTGLRGTVFIEELPPPRTGGAVSNAIVDIYDWFAGLFEARDEFPLYREWSRQHATNYTEVVKALAGETASAVRIGERGLLVISVAVPVQRYKTVVGALLLSSASGEIEQALREVRLTSLKIFAVVLAITVAMSLYLAHTIARPIRQLARAAEAVRRGRGRQTTIPDFSDRRDEIGDLSGALLDMTEALWRRMDAIERFAADVAHEIKNPLTSLRSAVETVAKVKDAKRRDQLMAIILDDVARLDRLISDISHASRLDAQLSRKEWGEIDIAALLAALVAVREATLESDAEKEGAPRIAFEAAAGGPLRIRGDEDQLMQVFDNIVNNGLSFSPEGGVIAIAARRAGDDVIVTIDDQGPGIPEANLESIFERFYSARPAAEKFGTHSGLGLAISRQIVEVHGGTVRAENRIDPSGTVVGARFVVRLPGLEPGAGVPTLRRAES